MLSWKKQKKTQTLLDPSLPLWSNDLLPVIFGFLDVRDLSVIRASSRLFLHIITERTIVQVFSGNSFSILIDEDDLLMPSKEFPSFNQYRYRKISLANDQTQFDNLIKNFRNQKYLKYLHVYTKVGHYDMSTLIHLISGSKTPFSIIQLNLCGLESVDPLISLVDYTQKSSLNRLSLSNLAVYEDEDCLGGLKCKYLTLRNCSLYSYSFLEKVEVETIKISDNHNLFLQELGFEYLSRNNNIKNIVLENIVLKSIIPLTDLISKRRLRNVVFLKVKFTPTSLLSDLMNFLTSRGSSFLNGVKFNKVEFRGEHMQNLMNLIRNAEFPIVLKHISFNVPINLTEVIFPKLLEAVKNSNYKHVMYYSTFKIVGLTPPMRRLVLRLMKMGNK